MPQQSPIRLVQVLLNLYTFHIVGFFDIQRDNAICMAGQYLRTTRLRPKENAIAKEHGTTTPATIRAGPTNLFRAGYLTGAIESRRRRWLDHFVDALLQTLRGRMNIQRTLQGPPHVAGCPAGRWHIAFQGIVHHHAVCVETPAQGSNSALHPFNPPAWQSVPIALVV